MVKKGSLTNLWTVINIVVTEELIVILIKDILSFPKNKETALLELKLTFIKFVLKEKP